MVWRPRIVFGTAPLHGQSSHPPSPYVKRWPCGQATLAICQNWMLGKNVCWTRVGSWASVELHSRFHERPWHSSRRLYIYVRYQGATKLNKPVNSRQVLCFGAVFRISIEGLWQADSVNKSYSVLCLRYPLDVKPDPPVQAPWHFVCGSLLACGCSKSCAPFIKLPVPLPKLCFAQATREVRSFTILSMAAAQSSFTWQWQHATGPSLKWHHRAGKEPSETINLWKNLWRCWKGSDCDGNCINLYQVI